jgi:hypothetical protein
MSETKTWRDVAPDWYIQLHDFIHTPIEGDTYERSAFTILLDDVTGVTENQMRIRAGLEEIKVAPQPAPTKDWVDHFEEFLDKRLAFLIQNRNY